MKCLIIYDNEEKQCQYIATQIADSVGCPCFSIEHAPEPADEEALILVKKEHYNNETSDALMRYVTNTKMPSVKMVLIIHSISSLLGHRHSFYYYSNKGSYISRLSTESDACNESRLHRTLASKGISVVDDCLCSHSPFLLGRISSLDMQKTIGFVRSALGLELFE